MHLSAVLAKNPISSFEVAEHQGRKSSNMFFKIFKKAETLSGEIVYLKSSLWWKFSRFEKYYACTCDNS